jgi:predicted SnoaL-like aldol condensation-catalyzing enzyme
VHSCVQHAPSEPDIAVVHIFRFESERIAELWDVGMQAPKDSPNQYGLF